MDPRPAPKKLLDQVQDTLRLKHYSIRTEQAYVNWIKRFILFHNKRHPKEMGAPEIGAFLTHLAVNENVAASTQNQALSALLFLYREVLRQELDGSIDALHAKKLLENRADSHTSGARFVGLLEKWSECEVFICLSADLSSQEK